LEQASRLSGLICRPQLSPTPPPAAPPYSPLAFFLGLSDSAVKIAVAPPQGRGKRCVKRAPRGKLEFSDPIPVDHVFDTGYETHEYFVAPGVSLVCRSSSSQQQNKGWILRRRQGKGPGLQLPACPLGLVPDKARPAPSFSGIFDPTTVCPGPSEGSTWGPLAGLPPTRYRGWWSSAPPGTASARYRRFTA
jgi:hypothetical protein